MTNFPFNYRTGLSFGDILPENAKSYDKMRPPKKDGQATTVFFHVTVMGLDSIDETSMVGQIGVVTEFILKHHSNLRKSYLLCF